MKLKLTLTPNQFHDMWSQVHKMRAGSKVITIDKAVLVALLLDHSHALAALGQEHYEETTPAA